ncbi:hypothetical protein RJ43_05550 [Alteromonas macleodii]|uniref:ECF-type sigma factor n=1 Tax=Alteromonas macleodii TaxID=28108 RepID=UPI00057EE4AB|nr:ECF-type sigma factor [Alteromonas macleodii]KHT55620.1 hypothetical protein RJ43_05550 [Alteromonas macleodii]|tara:strand:- start:4065 stop:4661 length:597 start_codon:yes stop_codon:yes gene_type:complete
MIKGINIVHTQDLATLLERSQSGDRHAWNTLFETVYPSLKRIVANRISPHREHMTISTTEMVHNVYLKFEGQQQFNWQNKAHFFSILARVSRRVVIDYLRSKQCEKRGAMFTIESFEPNSQPIDYSDIELWLTINQLLESLHKVDPDIAELTELRFFVGLSLEEIAQLKQISLSTAKRKWRFAQSWFNRCLDCETSYA